jgi:dTDP-4-amino-4,6-dideoxygalactose transaminase
VIWVSDRDGLQEHLTAAGIGTGIHYPVPLHRSAAYEHLGFASGDFPVAERTAAGILSLPMFPGLTAEQQSRVASEVIRYVRSRGAIEPQRILSTA